MARTGHHFQIRRPSPTTVLYKVSTAAPRSTYASIVLYNVLLGLRILIGVLTLAVLAWKLLSLSDNVPVALFTRDQSPSSLDAIAYHVQQQSWTHLLPVSLVILFLVLWRYHTEESLLVLRSLGIQTSTLSASYILPSTTRFIPTSSIRDIFIHEAFRGFEVRYYLAVVVENEQDVVVVFPRVLPGRDVLEEVWRGARGCLYDGDDDDGELRLQRTKSGE